MAKFDFSRSSSFDKAEESPGFLLWRASTLWRRSIEQILKPLGLTHPQFVVLATIGWFSKDGANASQAEIGRHASLDPNTISQILRSLQTKKWIERKRSKDERSKYTSLTPLGAKILAKALPAVEGGDAEFFAAVNLKKTNALKALQMLANTKDTRL